MQFEVVDLDDFPSAPSRRYGHTSTHVDSVLYIFGGADADPPPTLPPSPVFFSTMFRFDTRIMEWDPTVHTDSLSGVGRHQHTSVLNPATRCLYLFGGKSNGYRNDVVQYDCASGEFSLCEPLVESAVPSPRWGHSAILRPGGRSFLIFGGYDSNGFVHNSLHEFVFDSHEWNRIEIDGLRDIPRRYLHSAALVLVPTSSEGSPSSSQYHYLIARGLQKNKQALSDIWSIGFNDLTKTEEGFSVQQVIVDDLQENGVHSDPSEIESSSDYGQRAFVIQSKVYLYGGRRSGGDDVTQCLCLDLREDVIRIRENEKETVLRGHVREVSFPFRRSPLAYGTVNVIEEEKRTKILLFGGQRSGKRAPVQAAALRPAFPIVFASRAANLLHFCPDDALLIMLAYLDRLSLCRLQCVSSRWSPSLLSSHNRLWEPLYHEARQTTEFPVRREEIEVCSSMKEKCLAVLRIDEEEADVVHFMERKVGFVQDEMFSKESFFEARAKSLGGATINLKCVAVGNGLVGKTCLMITYAWNSFPHEHVPTVFDNFLATVHFADRIVNLCLWDQAGSENLDQLRILSYPETNVFLVCFSVVDRQSFEHVSTRWLPEVRHHSPHAAILLIGTKSDLRQDLETIQRLQEEGKKPISQDEAEFVARRERVQAYVETSAKTGVRVKECFDVALREDPNYFGTDILAGVEGFASYCYNSLVGSAEVPDTAQAFFNPPVPFRIFISGPDEVAFHKFPSAVSCHGPVVVEPVEVGICQRVDSSGVWIGYSAFSDDSDWSVDYWWTKYEVVYDSELHGSWKTPVSARKYANLFHEDFSYAWADGSQNRTRWVQYVNGVCAPSGFGIGSLMIKSNVSGVLMMLFAENSCTTRRLPLYGLTWRRIWEKEDFSVSRPVNEAGNFKSMYKTSSDELIVRGDQLESRHKWIRAEYYWNPFCEGYYRKFHLLALDECTSSATQVFSEYVKGGKVLMSANDTFFVSQLHAGGHDPNCEDTPFIYYGADLRFGSRCFQRDTYDFVYWNFMEVLDRQELSEYAVGFTTEESNCQDASDRFLSVDRESTFKDLTSLAFYRRETCATASALRYASLEVTSNFEPTSVDLGFKPSCSTEIPNLLTILNYDDPACKTGMESDRLVLQDEPFCWNATDEIGQITSRNLVACFPISCWDVFSFEGHACSGNGRCVSMDTCVCKTGWSFKDCSLNAGLLGGVFGGVFGSVAILSIIILTVTASVMYCRAQSKKLSGAKKSLLKFQRLQDIDDIDILLAEKTAVLIEDGEVLIDDALFDLSFDDIHLERAVGTGGSGAMVYFGQWASEPAVAIKVFNLSGLSKIDLESIEREISVLSTIHHPQIVRYIGAAIRHPRIALVMEYCRFGDLKHFLLEEIRRNLPVSTHERIRLLSEVATAMGFLHAKGIAHRDLKPSNVLVAEDRSARVMDFGLSRTLQATDQSLTCAVGTSPYIAPEVVLGESGYDNRVDVYSFGIVCHGVMSLNFRPYAEATHVEYRAANDPKFRPKVEEMVCPQAIRDLAVSCWSSAPNDRPSFNEIGEILSGIWEDS